MLNCHQATQLLSEKMDRPLNIKENMSLVLHTSMCSACRNFGNQMDEIRNISRNYMKQDLKDNGEKENR